MKELKMNRLCKINKIFGKQAIHLCENCKTGKETYELDSCSPFCPHLIYYENNKCVYYKPIEDCENKNKFSKKLISLIFRK